MISNTNMVSLQGNLVKDAEFNESVGVLNFTLALNFAGSVKDSDNNTGYFDVKMWLRDSPYVAPHILETVKRDIAEGRLAKGAKVSVVGRLLQERWTDDNGKTNARVVVVAENLNIIFAGGGKDGAAPMQQGEVKYAAGVGASEFNVDQF